MEDKYTFEQLDEEIQQQIMFELCDIGQESKYMSEMIEIQEKAEEWIKNNNEPKTEREWENAVMSR